MMRRFYFLFCFLILTTCDDGDILTVDLVFDQDLERCDDFEGSYLIFDTREDPNEALILIFPRNDENDALFTSATPVDDPIVIDIDETNNRFIYRTYNRSLDGNDICAVVPPSDLIIRENYEADAGGTVYITSTIEDDDNDGVPSEFEGKDPNGDGDFSDALDTDLDGIPDYLDEDDDNDNVKTSAEIDNSDGDNDPTTNPLNTDADLPNGDTIPDYLDKDDDGDGIDTIEEDEDGNQNPLDDTSINNGLSIPHFRNNFENTPYPSPGVTDDNEYTRTVTTHFLITAINIQILRATEVDMGTITTVIPDYNPED